MVNQPYPFIHGLVPVKRDLFGIQEAGRVVDECLEEELCLLSRMEQEKEREDEQELEEPGLDYKQTVVAVDAFRFCNTTLSKKYDANTMHEGVADLPPWGGGGNVSSSWPKNSLNYLRVHVIFASHF